MQENKLPQRVPPRKNGKVAKLPTVTSDIYRLKSSDALLREANMSARPAILAGMGILALFVLGMFLWMMYIPLRGDIHVSGEVVFKTKRQSVQHLEGGIIKEILVKDGDMVQAGQPLIKLESTQVQPIVTMLDEQSIAETAYMARVEAESKGLPAIRFPSSLTKQAKDPAVAKCMQDEERVFTARRVVLQNQVQAIRSEIAQLDESTKGSMDRLASKKQEITLLKEQLEANETLQKEGYVTKTLVMDYQRSLAAQNGEYQTIAASIASDKQRLLEMKQRILSLNAEQIQGAVNEMKQSTQRRIEQQERIRPLRDTLERQVIRAPITGRIVGLKVTTIGGIIMPREPLLEIAPIGDHLILDAKVRLEDVGEVKIGQIADVLISGVHPIERPDVKAKVTYLSDDRIAPGPGQQSYYAAELDFDQKSLKTLRGATLKPGMSAMISIATKARTPFSDALESLREHFLKSRSTR